MATPEDLLEEFSIVCEYLKTQVNEPEAASLIEDVERSRKAPVWADEEA